MSKLGRSCAVLGIGFAGALFLTIPGTAFGGAVFTTFNPHVDGATKNVCKNGAVNCNLYGAAEYVWLNGGPTANGLRPDGDYFFAVLTPGGQPNPNDGSASNLSDDRDSYTNRTFTVANGEVSLYTGTHWLDDGKSGPKPNGKVPFIRLWPYQEYADSRGVYVLAVCSLAEGYPVEPRDCDFDAFQVRKKAQYSFMLSGTKFKDTYADGKKNGLGLDPGLAGWSVTINGTGPDGLPVDGTAVTDAGGYWQWISLQYSLPGGMPVPVHLAVCEVSQSGWTQSYPVPATGCHSVDLTPPAWVGFDSIDDLDFGNWQPVTVTACKVRDLDGFPGGATVAVPDWQMTLAKDGAAVETRRTGTDGCYTWTGLQPGSVYGLIEEAREGWTPLDSVERTFDRARSNDTLHHVFINVAPSY